MNSHTPAFGFLREKQILGSKKEGIPAILPVGRTMFWAGVKSGKFPQPIKLGPRAIAWRLEDIKKLVEQLGAAK